MSDNQKKIAEGIERNKEFEKKKRELQEKKLIVDTHKYTNELERIQRNQEDVKKVSEVNVGYMSPETIQDIQEKSRIYFDSSKNGMTFLDEIFRKWVPCWPGNIILLGGKTGQGKSSVAANLILSTVQQINPATGKNRKVLCVSAEETPSAVFGRLTCLVKGYNFNEQDEFTEAQKQELIDFVPKWARIGVSVIGEDGFGITNTLEGINSILKNLIETKTHYDLIVIDYIQKITASKNNPQMQQFMVLKEVMNSLDNFKNVYPGAIVVLSQLSPDSEENKKDFQERIRGSKDIITPCTVALELVPDFNLLKSVFWVWKNRYKGSTVGKCVTMGYDRGRFIPYSEEFKKRVSEIREVAEHSSLMEKVEQPPKGE